MCAEAELDLMGVEDQTVGNPDTQKEIHRILLGAEIVILEGLVLGAVPEGTYFLAAQPMKMADLDVYKRQDAEDQKRIFHSFEQAGESTARRFGGTGLGLAISSQLVQMMDGEISLESQPGKGSKFSFAVVRCV